MAKLRLVVAGLVHDHVWGMLPQFSRLAGVEIVGAADPNRPLLERIKREYGVERLFRNYRELFAKVKADAVLICSSNAGSAPIAVEAARRGLHLMVEKPMAATVEQARAMARAARHNGVRLMVNWPLAWNPETVKAMDLVRRGMIGQVFYARVHMAHQGPKEAGCSKYFWGWLYDRRQNGGGAIIDYCGYGAAVFASLWGRPRQVMGVARNLVKPRFPVDDNAIITAIYGKRIALAEASWTQDPDFHDVLFLGKGGTLETDRGRLVHSWTKKRHMSHYGAKRLQVKVLPVTRPAAGRRNGPEHFVHCLRTGKPFIRLCTAEVGVAAQEILSAGVTSDRTGRRVTLPSSSR